MQTTGKSTENNNIQNKSALENSPKTPRKPNYKDNHSTQMLPPLHNHAIHVSVGSHRRPIGGIIGGIIEMQRARVSKQ